MARKMQFEVSGSDETTPTFVLCQLASEKTKDMEMETI